MDTNGATPTLADVPSDEELVVLGKTADEIGREFPFDVPLRFPVQAHGETVSTLTLQRPTGADLFHCGDPFADGLAQSAKVRSLFALISRLAGVPESTVKQLSVQDIKTVEFLLHLFFQPSAATLRPIFSILRTSGETSEA